jgi:hypothetical protein
MRRSAPGNGASRRAALDAVLDLSKVVSTCSSPTSGAALMTTSCIFAICLASRPLSVSDLMAVVTTPFAEATASWV